MQKLYGYAVEIKIHSLNGWDVFMVQIFALHYWQYSYLVKSHTVNKIVRFNMVQMQILFYFASVTAMGFLTSEQ